MKGERRRVMEALTDGIRRWATGIFAVWYPIQDGATRDEFLRRIHKLEIPKTLVVELMVRKEEPFRLNGSGMILINPPGSSIRSSVLCCPFSAIFWARGARLITP